MNTTFLEIPETYKINNRINQNTYLVDGELKKWNGNTAEVYSTISSTSSSDKSSDDSTLSIT